MRLGRGAAALVLVAAACGDGGGSGFGPLVDYAVGDWGCMLEGDGFTSVLQVTVEADSASSGSFEFEAAGAAMPRGRGEWRLDGRSLEMEIDDLSSYAVTGVDLDTAAIEILEDAPGSELQQVDVDREGDTVTFSWSDPWTGAPTTLQCTKP